MALFSDIKIGDESVKEPTPTKASAIPPISKVKSTSLFGGIGTSTPSIPKAAGVFSGVSVTPEPIPTPYFAAVDKSGSYGFSDTEKDVSGRPFFAYRNPGDVATTTDKTRVATQFDPRVPSKVTRDSFYNPRAEGLRQQFKDEMGIAYNEELDHRIALALSGSNDPANLKPITNNKDSAIITDLQKKVINGEISLFDAQISLAKKKGFDVPFTGKKSGFFESLTEKVKAGAQKAYGVFKNLGDEAENLLRKAQEKAPLKELATTLKEQVTSPSEAQREIEQKLFPEMRNVPVAGPIANVVQRGLRVASRVILPGTEPIRKDIDELAIAGALQKGIDEGTIPANVLDDLEVLKKTNAQIVGDVALGIVSLYTPGIAKNLVVSSVGKPITSALATGFIQTAIDAGIPFGIAQSLSSGTADPKEIAKIMASNIIVAGTIGAVLKGTIPVGSATMKILQQAKNEFDKIPNKQGGFISIGGREKEILATKDIVKRVNENKTGVFKRDSEVVTELPPGISQIVGDEKIHLSEFIVAKIKGLIKNQKGHPKITDEVLAKIPDSLSQPEKILGDDRTPNSSKYLFINPDPLHQIVVELHRTPGGKTEINTVFDTTDAEVKRLEAAKLPVLYTSGRTPSSAYVPLSKESAGRRFSGPQNTDIESISPSKEKSTPEKQNLSVQQKGMKELSTKVAKEHGVEIAPTGDLILYHGTRERRAPKVGEDWRVGSYFTSDLKTAEQFAGQGTGGKIKIMKVEVPPHTVFPSGDGTYYTLNEKIPVREAATKPVVAFKKATRYFPVGRGPKIESTKVAELLKGVVPPDKIKYVFDPKLLKERGLLGAFQQNKRMEMLNPAIKPVIDLYMTGGKVYVRTAFHEAYHYLENKVFSKEFVEQLNKETLSKMTSRDHAMFDRKTYTTPEARASEYRAEEFAKVETKKAGYQSPIMKVIGMVRAALRKIVAAGREMAKKFHSDQKGAINFFSDMHEEAFIAEDKLRIKSRDGKNEYFYKNEKGEFVQAESKKVAISSLFAQESQQGIEKIKPLEGKLNNDSVRNMFEKVKEEITPNEGVYSFGSKEEVVNFIRKESGKPRQSSVIDGTFEVNSVTENHLFGKERTKEDYARRTKLFGPGLEIAEKTGVLIGIDKETNRGMGITYYEIIGVDPRLPNTIVRVKLSEVNKNGKAYFTVSEISGGARVPATPSSGRRPARLTTSDTDVDTLPPSSKESQVPTEIRPSYKETLKGELELNKIEQRERAKKLLEFQKSEIKNNPTLVSKTQEVKLLEEYLANDPARGLVKYANKQTGELPEVIGGVSGKFGRSGDDIVTELGFKDSEQAREAYQAYVRRQRDLEQAKNELRTLKTKAREGVAEVEDKARLERILNKTAAETQKIIDQTNYKEALKRAEQEAVERIKKEETYKQTLQDKINLAKNQAIQSRGIFAKIKQALHPIKPLDATTKDIVQTWLQKKIAIKELGEQEAQKFATQEGNDFHEVLEYQAGKQTPWIREAFDSLFTEAKRRGLDLNYKEDYIPQVYKERPEQITRAITKYMEENGVDKKMIEGYLAENTELPEAIALRLKLRPNFIKTRVFPDYKTAFKYGLTPKFETPAQLIAYYREEMESVLNNKQLIDKLKSEAKILKVDDAPDSWQFIKLPFLKKEAYKAHPDLAELLNGYFRDESNLSYGQIFFKGLSAASKYLQEIKLSAGVPFTNINFFSTGNAIKLLTTSVGEAATGKFKQALTSLKASFAYIRANSDGRSAKWFYENREYVKMMAEEGIDVSGRIGTYRDTSWHDFKNIFTGSNFRAGIQRIKAITKENFKTEIPAAWKDLSDAFGLVFDKAFNEKTFKSFMAQVSTQIFKDTYNMAIEKGVASEEAQKFAGELTKNYGGLITDIGRSADLKDQLGGLFFAPHFRESLINVFYNVVKGLTTERKTASFAKNRSLFAGIAITYALYNILNQKINGHYMWENEPGREFALRIPLPNKQIGYFEFMPSQLSFVRNILSGLIATGKGDFGTASQKAGTLFSMPLKIFSELLGNQDYFGRPIYDSSLSVWQQKQKIAEYVGLQTLHPYITETYKYLQGKQPLYQTLNFAMELPFKFDNVDNILRKAEAARKREKAIATKERKPAIIKIYKEAKKLKAEGKQKEADALVIPLSDADYKIYTSIKAEDKKYNKY